MVQIMACLLFGAKPLSKQMLCYNQLNPHHKRRWNFNQNTKLSRKGISMHILLIKIESNSYTNALQDWHLRGLQRLQYCLVVDNKLAMGLLPDTYNRGFRMHRECWERLPRHRRLAIPTCITHMRDARTVMHAGIADPRFPLISVAGKHSRQFLRMRNAQFCVSGKSSWWSISRKRFRRITTKQPICKNNLGGG